MHDSQLVKEILNQVFQAINRILKRFETVTSPDFFSVSEEGREKLDSICMQLIAIGESIKNLDKITEGKLFSQYPNIEWKKVKGIRDVISHHYFDVDNEIVYNVCKVHIPLLLKTVKKMLDEIE